MMALSTNIFSLYLLCFLLLSLQIHARLSQFFDKSMLMTTSHFPAGYPSTHRGSFSYHNSPGRYLHGSFGLVSVPSGRVPVSVYVPETTTTTTTTSTTTANNDNQDMGDYKSNNPQKTNSDDSHEKTPTDDSSSLWDSLKSNYPYLFVFVMFSFIGYPVYNRNSNNNNNSNNINSNNSNSNNNWPNDRRRREVEFSEIRFPAENYSLVRDQHEIHSPRGQYRNGSLLPVNNIYDNGVSLDGSSNCL